MHTKANGISIHHTVEGPDGAPWIAFSNSLITNLTMWDEQAAALSKSYRVLRYDQRGHGGTEVTPGPYHFDTLADDVIALFDALSIKHAHFVGLSMGGVTALNLAQRHPGRVDHIVACDCPPASTPAGAQQWAERIALAKDKGMEALVDVTVNRWYSPEFAATQNPVLKKVGEMIRTTPFEGFAGCAGALSNYDLRPGFGAIKAPVLLICGSKDAALPGVKALHDGVAGSQFIKLEGAGHISNTEKPAEFTAALEKFLKS
jgi:3-oxoadipate enol-lactonase